MSPIVFQKIIGAYVKSLRKGIDELKPAGERGQTLRDKYQAEISYLEQYLPQLMDEAATKALVKKTVADLGVSEPKDTGRVMGAIMKDHKAEVDAQLVRKLVSEMLPGS